MLPLLVGLGLVVGCVVVVLGLWYVVRGSRLEIVVVSLWEARASLVVVELRGIVVHLEWNEYWLRWWSEMVECIGVEIIETRILRAILSSLHLVAQWVK